MKNLVLLAFVLSSVGPSSAAEPGAAIRVKYVSGENVYLDAGLADSLGVGDRLIVKKGDSTLAEIEIAFAAEHSASCKILSLSGTIISGDIAILSMKANRPQEETPAPTVALPPPATQPPAISEIQARRTPRAGISGSVSVQYYKWNDTGASNLDFSQPSLRLNFKAERLWGQDFSVNFRSHIRYDQRTRPYSSTVPETDWRNRVYQLSLAYSNEQSPFSFEAGRIISNKISGIGYIDGLLIRKGVTGSLQLGAFAGTQPQWQYSDFQTSLQKYGAYLGLAAGDVRSRRLESSLAFAGEYHGGTVSREFVYFRNNLIPFSGWSIYQSAEIDINRDWRKEKAGGNISLTNLYLAARGKLTGWLSAGLSYDTRRNYWTYDTRSVADSLFDDILRRGLRADFSLRPGRNYLIFSNFGYNKRSSDTKATYSYSLGFNNANFILARQFLNLQFAGFSSPFTDGYNYSVKLGRNIRSGDMISVASGSYVYTYGSSSLKRENRWYQLSGRFDLVRRTYGSASYEYDTGDDTKGHRMLAELGYRF